MDGHATSVGGAIIDSGNFDWTQNDKFPGLTTPDESYHGVTYTERFGKGAYITKATAQLMRDLGSIPSPHNAFLLGIGLETLFLRVQRHCENAQKVAEFLEENEKGRMGQLPGSSEQQGFCARAEIYAARHERRGLLRRKGRQGSRNPLHGSFGACRHRHPCGGRAHLCAAPREHDAPPASPTSSLMRRAWGRI